MKYIIAGVIMILTFILWIVFCFSYSVAFILNFLWSFKFLKWGEFSTKKVHYVNFTRRDPLKNPIETLKHFFDKLFLYIK